MSELVSCEISRFKHSTFEVMNVVHNRHINEN